MSAQMAGHWIVVGFNALGNAAFAGFFASLLLVGAGLISGFWRVWRDPRFRPRKLGPALAWGLAWSALSIANVIERLRPSKVGGVQAFSAIPFPDDSADVQRQTRFAIFVHGTYGRLQNYDWSRWASIATEVRRTGWTPLRFAWSGGNTSTARSRAARALVAEIEQLRSTRPGASILLLGHSHGGTVCLEAARQTSVRAVVTLATPHVATKKKDGDQSSLGIGAVTRIVVPGAILAAMAHFEVFERTLGHLWPVGRYQMLGAVGIGVVIAFLIFMHRLISGDRELQRRILSSSAPCLGDAEVLSITLESDDVLVELQRIDRSASLAKVAVDKHSRYGRIFDRMTEFPGTKKRRSRVGSWLREWGLFTLLGASLIFLGAMALWYNWFSLDEETKRTLRPWFFPATNYAQLKYLIYTLVLGSIYALVAFALGRRRLPAWHRAAFRVGHYLAMLSRLSQLHSFKAGLLGLPGLALHVHDASVQAAPTGGKSYLIDRHVANAHSAILELEETAVAVRAVATRALRSKDGSGAAAASSVPADPPKESLTLKWHVVTALRFGSVTLSCLAAFIWITYYNEAPDTCGDGEFWCSFQQGVEELREFFQLGFGAVILIGILCTFAFWMMRPRKGDNVKFVDPPAGSTATK